MRDRSNSSRFTHSPNARKGAHRCRARGFTLLEMLVIVGVVGILAGLALPELMSVIRRSKIEGAAQTVTQRMNEARAEAIYRGAPVIVHPDERLNKNGDLQHYLVAWVDVDDNGRFDGIIGPDGLYEADPVQPFRTVDYPLFQWPLPYRGPNKTDNNVYFWGAADGNPMLKTDAIDGLSKKPDGVDNPIMLEAEGYGDWQSAVVFLDNGSVAEEGGIRIAMGPFEGTDREINFLELRIAPRASGRIELRKYIPAPIGTYEGKGFDNPNEYGYKHEWEWY